MIADRIIHTAENSRNLFILRRYQCLSLFDSAMTQQYTTCLHVTQTDADSSLSSSVLLETVSAQMDSVVHLGNLEKLGSKGPFFVNSDSFSWLSLWPLVPAGVWNGSTVLMLHSTGWGFPAQPDAGSPGNLAKEPAYICQLSCCLLVYSCGGLALIVWMPPTSPVFTHSD